MPGFPNERYLYDKLVGFATTIFCWCFFGGMHAGNGRKVLTPVFLAFIATRRRCE
jgi:hypothetical protein